MVKNSWDVCWILVLLTSEVTFSYFPVPAFCHSFICMTNFVIWEELFWGLMLLKLTLNFCLWTYYLIYRARTTFGLVCLKDFWRFNIVACCSSLLVTQYPYISMHIKGFFRIGGFSFQFNCIIDFISLNTKLIFVCLVVRLMKVE